MDHESIARRLLCVTLASLIVAALALTAAARPGTPTSAQSPVVQNQHDTPLLEQGKAIERELAGAGSHSYQVALTANQYLVAVVDQRGIDVVFTVFAPDGQKLMEIDSPNGAQGPEQISLVTDAPGNYKLEVRSLDKTAKAGRYEVKIADLRTASEQDRRRGKAQRAFAEADQLAGQRTAVSFRKAIEKYGEALQYWREAQDKAGEANTLNNLGVAHFSLGETRKALEYLGQALPIIRAINDKKGEGETLTNMGFMHDALGEKQKALEHYNEALPILRAAGNRMGEAATLNNMGMVYDSIGEKRKALDFYDQVLPIARAIGERNGEASTLSNVGKIYRDIGENKKALERFNQALEIQRALGNHRGEAITLNNIGATFNEMGESQMALDRYMLAVQLSRTAGDRKTESGTLVNLGAVYSELGEKQTGLDYYNQSLAITRDIGDRRGEALARNNIGEAYSDLGERQKALEYYDQALTILRTVGDRGLQGSILNNMGGIYSELGDKAKALDYYNQALVLFRAVTDRREEANTLSNIGEVHYKSGDKGQALDYFNQSLPLRRAVGDRNREAITLLGIARVERDRSNYLEALEKIEAALTIIESLRSKIASEKLRASYFASVQNYYEVYIDLLMRLHQLRPSEGYDARALQMGERARARSLLDLLIESKADIRQGVDPQLLERERGLQELLNAKAERQLRLMSSNNSGDTRAEALAKELAALAIEYQEVEAQIRARSPRYASLTQPQPLTLRQIQTEVLDPNTLLLEYSLGEERSYLWAVTPNSITSYVLPKRSEIEEASRMLYARLTTTERSRAQRGIGVEGKQASLAEAGVRLSQMVLAPAAAQLKRKRLLIVADGALQYIPFGALPAPAVQNRRRVASRPLIIDHEIVNLPSASVIALMRREMISRKPAAKGLVVLADPVFDAADERNKGTPASGTAAPAEKAGSKTRGLGLEKSMVESGVADAALNIPRLPGTRREAQAILSLASDAENKQALDFEASRATAMSPELSQYRYVHFATHGLLNSVHPELSGIVLSMVNEGGTPQDGFLRAHEVFNLHLSADLVVLSACQTGLGKEVRGEGLVGMTRGFMYAGTPRVVVSLWSVSDVGTAELMERFYKGLLVDKLRPAAALRAAQVSMWREKRWTSPFYWAAFSLQGEWR